jgi:hypothetical protein
MRAMLIPTASLNPDTAALFEREFPELKGL